jgi:hypothetical protein
MNKIQKLTLAEKIASEQGRWAEFSGLYNSYRDEQKVMPSLERALTDMGLLAEFKARVIHT